MIMMMPHSLQIFARTGTLRSSLKETAVRAVPGLYGLNGIESKQIAKRVEDWLDREAYILPQRNNMRIIHFLVDFMPYLRSAGKAGFSETIPSPSYHFCAS